MEEGFSVRLEAKSSSLCLGLGAGRLCCSGLWLHQGSPTPRCLLNPPAFSASLCLASIPLRSEAFHRPSRTLADVCVFGAKWKFEDQLNTSPTERQNQAI